MHLCIFSFRKKILLSLHTFVLMYIVIWNTRQIYRTKIYIEKSGKQKHLILYESMQGMEGVFISDSIFSSFFERCFSSF